MFLGISCKDHLNKWKPFQKLHVGLDQAHKNYSSRGKSRYLKFPNPLQTALPTLHSIMYFVDGEEGKSGYM